MHYLGIILGAILLAVKYGSFYLLTGGKDQWRVPFTDQGIRDWVYKSPVRTGILDLASGYVGMHAILACGAGSIIGMIAMITYMTVCMAMIFGGILFHKLWSSITTSKQGLKHA